MNPMTRVAVARWVLGLTAACVIAGVAIQLPVTATNTESEFDTAITRMVNIFFFFTIQSNILVGVASWLLTRRMSGRSWGFAAFRLTGLLGITITGLVYHWLLSGLAELTFWGHVADILLHTVVPLLAVLGWLLWPLETAEMRMVPIVLIFPVVWVTITLLRGAALEWYPYPFIDVIELGYPRVAVNCAAITVLFLVVLLVLIGGNALLRRGQWQQQHVNAGAPPREST